MIQVTKIGPQNQQWFEKFLITPENAENMIRLGVIEDDTACGAAAFRIGRRGAELMSLYVVPEFRRRGAAQSMLDTFLELGGEVGLTSLMTVYMRDNAEMRAFLDKNGFLQLDSSESYFFLTQDVLQSGKLTKIASSGIPGNCVPVDKLPPTRQRALERFVRKGGFVLRGAIRENCTGEMSFAVVDADSLPVACMLCTDMGEWITIDVLLSKANSQIAILKLFEVLYRKLEADNRQKTEIRCLAVNEKVGPLLRLLFGDKVQMAGSTVCAVKTLEER